MSLSPKTGLVYIPTVHVGAMLIAEPARPAKWLPRPHEHRRAGGILRSARATRSRCRPRCDHSQIRRSSRRSPPSRCRPRSRPGIRCSRKVVWSMPATFVHGPRWRHSPPAVAWWCRAASTASCASFRDTDGTLLKEIEVGTPMIAAPATYTVDGVQYIAILAGSGGGGWNTWMPRKCGVPEGQCAIASSRSGSTAARRQCRRTCRRPGPLPEPPAQTGTAADIAAGAQAFRRQLRRLPHATSWPHASAGPAPLTAATHAAFKDIVLRGALQPRGMPRWDDLLSTTSRWTRSMPT